MTLLEKLNQTDRFAHVNGVRLTYVGEGVARAEMDVSEDHLNGGGVCQGGAIFTLADLAFAAVSNGSGVLTLGINNSISFLASAVLGDHLVAEAREDTSMPVAQNANQGQQSSLQPPITEQKPAPTAGHKKLPHATVRITNQDGTLIAVVTGLAYRKRESFPFEGLM